MCGVRLYACAYVEDTICYLQGGLYGHFMDQKFLCAQFMPFLNSKLNLEIVLEDALGKLGSAVQGWMDGHL